MVNRYYEGTLSESNETILKELLKNSKDDEYPEIKKQLEIMEKLSKYDDVLSDDFDEKILNSLSTKTINKRKLYTNVMSISAFAATILILITVYFSSGFFNSNTPYNTVSDPVIAFSEAKKALQEVSKNMNKGAEPVAKTIKKAESGLEKTNDLSKAADAIDQMKTINKINKSSELLKQMTKVTVKLGKS